MELSPALPSILQRGYPRLRKPETSSIAYREGFGGWLGPWIRRFRLHALKGVPDNWQLYRVTA